MSPQVENVAFCEFILDDKSPYWRTEARYSDKWVIFPDVVRSVIVKQSVVNIVMRSGMMVTLVVKTIQIQKENVLVFLMDYHGRKKAKNWLQRNVNCIWQTSSPTHNSTGMHV